MLPFGKVNLSEPFSFNLALPGTTQTFCVIQMLHLGFDPNYQCKQIRICIETKAVGLFSQCQCQQTTLALVSWFRSLITSFEQRPRVSRLDFNFYATLTIFSTWSRHMSTEPIMYTSKWMFQSHPTTPDHPRLTECEILTLSLSWSGLVWPSVATLTFDLQGEATRGHASRV